MPTECSAEAFDFGTVEGRSVEAAFDAGLVTSDAGALLLGTTDRAIDLIDRFASCFHDQRRPEWIEHEVATLVGQRVFAIALGYEDLNDHDDGGAGRQARSAARGEVDPVSWTPICLSFGVHDVKEATIHEQAPPLCAGVPRADGRAGTRRSHAGATGEGV